MPLSDAFEQKLTQGGQCEQKFTKAKNFITNILSQQIPADLQVVSTDQSYFDDHGINHIQRVVAKLSNLCDLLNEPIIEREAFILLVAAYCHDLGMFLGRRADESPEDVRRVHHLRSGELIQQLRDRYYLELDDMELQIVRRVVEAHRILDLAQLPEDQWIEGDKIRTRLLGALLRISDASDCDRSRAPKTIFDIFFEKIPEASREYWKEHFPITDLHFDNKRASMVISINLDGTLEERIQSHRIANLLQGRLREELSSVSETFRNNGIRIVRVEIRDFNSGEYRDLSSLPKYENFVIIILKSDFIEVSQFIGIVNSFASPSNGNVSLIIEIRPPEGPLYIDGKFEISSNNVEEMQTRLAKELSRNFWGLDGNKVFEKKFIRGGITK